MTAIHPYAKLFPLASDEELETMAAGIKKNGQLEPVVLLDGMILDGVNRERAAIRAGVKPKYEKWKQNGIDPFDYVIEKNIRRRHLSATQKALLVLPIADMLRKRGLAEHGARTGKKVFNPAATEAAKVVGIGQATVRRAQYVKDHAPDLVEAMFKGELSSTKAFDQVRLREAHKSRVSHEQRVSKHAREGRAREVKEYLDATQDFIEDATTAVEVAAYGRFAPEAQNFVKRRHNTIRELLAKIEREFR